ncbi:hypothetical protein [Lederbergia lenta]|uniref:hypothetical protein n=1 Tax=Lederbergia lenta TaxID=1467 RepID=UPI00203B9D7C|nr:hypothetical protein [Lederbergia lenta]MCM3109891.1 hypothetical protein [Lederbergia lenta]
MNGWFLTIIILSMLNLGIHFSNHGKKREEKYDFWSALIGFALQMLLVYMAIRSGF